MPEGQDLRHGFGIATVVASAPLPTTAAVYTQDFLARMWERETNSASFCA